MAAMPSSNMLKLRLLIIALFMALALLLSSSITSYTKTKSKSTLKINKTSTSTSPSPSPSPSCFFPPKCQSLPQLPTKAIIHYATTNTTLHQTPQEIKMIAQVLAKRAPCNMLVFGLGHESLLWAALNTGGRTAFLEENQDWIALMRAQYPELQAHFVAYPNDTMVSDAFNLLKYAEGAPECEPARGDLEFSGCKLALQTLPAEVYNTEWDVIMVDAPAGYFPEAPGRMQAIYSSALMAVSRSGSGKKTDVLVHDVHRTVERMYSQAFLCLHNLVDAQGSLWHFLVSPKPKASKFCAA